MSQVLTLKRGDTAPAFRAQCLDGGSPLSLATALGVKLLMRSGSALVLSAPMVVEDQTSSTGWAHRNWQPADLASAGTYRAEVEVTWGDGKVQTFPADGYVTVQVTQDLG